MRELHIISAVEDIPRFRWETMVQLHSAKKYNLSEKFRILVFLPAYNELKGFSKQWREIEKMFPETQFFYYSDKQNKVTDLMVNYNYTPIHRLCSLERHFKAFPELEKAAILYIDSDVIFTSQPPLNDYLQDDINYLSDTHSYLNEEYLSGKIKDVPAVKKDAYIKANVVNKAASFAGLTISDIKAENSNTGGAQYLFKDVTSRFFSECIDICLLVRMYFQAVNQEFFLGDNVKEREDNGIQSWCADMWAIQWNLWRHKLPSKTPKWMDFAWATETVNKLDRVWMLHNAGITSPTSIRTQKDLKAIRSEKGEVEYVNAPALYKETYKLKSVFADMPAIENILNNEYSKRYCTHRYAQEVLETYNSLIKK